MAPCQAWHTLWGNRLVEELDVAPRWSPVAGWSREAWCVLSLESRSHMLVLLWMSEMSLGYVELLSMFHVEPSFSDPYSIGLRKILAGTLASKTPNQAQVLSWTSPYGCCSIPT